MRARQKQRRHDRQQLKQAQPDEYVRLGLLGDIGTGKASICIEFTKSKRVRASRPSAYDPTDEARFIQVIYVNDNPIQIQLINTTGQEEFSSVGDIYLNKCVGFLLIFSVDSASSFDNAKNIYFEKILRVKDVEDQEDVPCNIPIVMVGNKCDIDQSKREVSREEALNFCNKKYIKYIETSATCQVNIYEAFEMLAKEVVETQYICKMKSNLKSDDLDLKKQTSFKKHNPMRCVIL